MGPFCSTRILCGGGATLHAVRPTRSDGTALRATAKVAAFLFPRQSAVALGVLCELVNVGRIGGIAAFDLSSENGAGHYGSPLASRHSPIRFPGASSSNK
jgi:hypothetical protein